jgi:competence protein ComGC
MRNLIIVLIVVLIAWFSFKSFMPQKKEQNAVTQYADNLKQDEEKAEAAKDTVNLTVVRSAINSFHGSQGRFPDDLQELVSKGYLDRVPAGNYSYDKETGEVK